MENMHTDVRMERANRDVVRGYSTTLYFLDVIHLLLLLAPCSHTFQKKNDERRLTSQLNGLNNFNLSPNSLYKSTRRWATTRREKNCFDLKYILTSPASYGLGFKAGT